MMDGLRTPYQWLCALQKAKLGIEPCELKYISQQQFLRNLGEKDLAELAFKHHENMRQERLDALLEERKKIMEGSTIKKPKRRSVGEEVKGFDASDIVEKERKRLEVIKRRQERELAQLLQHEVTRQELQKKAEVKIQKVQERAEADRKAKAEKTKEWHKQQHEREQNRLQEEARKEKEAKGAELARYEKEMEAAARVSATEKQRRALARAKEIERAKKVEKSRSETEKLLAKQQEEVERKKAEMLARDTERERVKLEQQAVAVKQNEEARAKTESRIAAALQNNDEILSKRRTDFDLKEKEAETRRQLHEALRKAEEAKTRQEELNKLEQRKKAYRMAQRRESQRVATILEKQKSKTEALTELQHKREHEADIKSLQHQLELESKRDKVEAMKRRELYQRMTLLEKITQGTERAKSLMEERALLQEQRRTANIEASFQRQRLQETVSQMQSKKDWGNVNITEVLSKSLTKAH